MRMAYCKFKYFFNIYRELVPYILGRIELKLNLCVIVRKYINKVKYSKLVFI